MAYMGSCCYIGSIQVTNDFCAVCNLLEDVWTHTVILALRARHQISPRWLERM